MPERRWRLVNVLDVPGRVEPDDGVTAKERAAAREQLRDDRSARVELPGYPDVDHRWHAVREFLGVTAFGVAAAEAAAGNALIYAHHEVPYEQEELYLVFEGRVRFHCDGKEVEAARGDVLYLQPAVVRGAVALETPTMLFMVGGKPGAYEPPIWADDWRPPPEWLPARRSPQER
jgi:mannose-6-phosphate isomerase-like protein (cupin superfamily)